MSELSYHPILADAGDQVLEHRPARLLIIGEEVFDGAEAARSIRQLATTEVALPTGVYCFALDDGLAMLVAHEGVAPGFPTTSHWGAPDDDPLVNAYDWFCEWWESGHTIPHPKFDPGREVTLVSGGEEARVRRRSYHAAAWWYEVRVEGRTINLRESSLVEPAVDDDPLEWVTRTPAPAARFGATLTRAKLREHLTDTVYSFRASRTIFRPYQFRPVIRLLSSERPRLLIADEVGLGKTIEAGLVWTELDARNIANRVLVVCPSMLVEKWRAEMLERFGFELANLDRAALDELLERVEDDRLPARFHAICSLERLRVWRGLKRLAEIGPRFDLVVVDEAHAFRNSGTRSHALGALLADWADALIFLSATPLNLGNHDLYNLLELLAPGEFESRHVLEQRLEPNRSLNRIAASLVDRGIRNEDRWEWLDEIRDLTFGRPLAKRPEYRELMELLRRPELEHREIVRCRRLISGLHALSGVVTRTRKVEIQEQKAVREARPVPVELTEVERDLYFLYEAWQRERARKLGLPVGFATQMPLRLASTCLPAARNYVLDCTTSIADDDLDWLAEVLDEQSDPDVTGIDVRPPPELVAVAQRLGDVDSKFEAFLDALLPIVADGRRVLVFTFSRRALAYLERRLQGKVRFAVMHGGVDKDERHHLMRRFRAHEFDVMLASRVASEGLDFEYCSAVVNYDLPWNPMEVEQRIGRIDRFGQTEDKILILNLHTPGTIESDIIERIHERIGVFSDSIGELEPILQSRLSELRETIFDFELTPEQRQRRLDLMLAALEEQRLAREEVEEASSFLSSTDRAEIEGLEQDLLTTGRYVGQPELVLLLEDWAARRAGSSVRHARDGRSLMLEGTADMEADLRALTAAGERSALEIDELARALRNEQGIFLCLDQELARTSMEPLLSATHPLTRAALRVPDFVQVRLGSAKVSAAADLSGDYLVLIGIARWSGLRSSAEFWGAAVDLRDGTDAPDAVVDALFAALASAELEEGACETEFDPRKAVERAKRRLVRRQSEEGARRAEANEVMVETRRISLRETYARKVEQIERRIETAKVSGKSGKERAISLYEAQLRHQERLLREAEDELEQLRHGSMELEWVAACLLHVG